MIYLEEITPTTYTTASTNCNTTPSTNHTFLNADCFDVLKNIPDKSIDLIVTDPPYLVRAERKTASDAISARLMKKGKTFKDFSNSFDIKTFAAELKRIQPKINAYIFCCKAQLLELLKTFVEEYNCKFEILIWYKTNVAPVFNLRYLSDKEYLVYFKESGAKCDPKSKKQATTLYVSPMTQKESKNYNHPTVKPLELIKQVILNSSNKGDTILDTFAGSGTVAVAAANLKRNSINIEKNAEYFEVMKQRFLTEADLN